MPFLPVCIRRVDGAIVSRVDFSVCFPARVHFLPSECTSWNGERTLYHGWLVCRAWTSRHTFLDLHYLRGLEGYFRDPEKCKIFYRETGFDCNTGSGIHKYLDRGCGILAFRREFGKSSRTKMYFLVGKADQPGEHSVVSPSQANKRVTWSMFI